MKRRMGRFKIDFHVLSEDEEAARAIFKDVIVWRAENSFVTRAVEVWGVHPSFDPVAEGEEAPLYTATIRDEVDVADRRMISVSWQRERHG